MERYDYKVLALTIAAVSMVTGLLLMMAPNVLIKAGEFFNRAYNVENTVYTRRLAFGLAYILAGCILLYILW